MTLTSRATGEGARLAQGHTRVGGQLLDDRDHFLQRRHDGVEDLHVGEQPRGWRAGIWIFLVVVLVVGRRLQQRWQLRFVDMQP